MEAFRSQDETTCFYAVLCAKHAYTVLKAAKMKTIDLSKQQDVLKLHRSISSLLQITEDFDKAEAIGECTVFLCSLYHVKSFGLPLSRLDKSTAIKRMIEELYE